MYAPRNLPTLLGADSSPGGDASRAAYLAWASSVKAHGGTVVAYPFHGTMPFLAWSDLFSDHDTYGLPAARYPMAIAGNMDAEPDNVSSTPNGDVAYYLAPVNVLRWASSSEGLASWQNLQATGNDQTTPDQNEAPWYKNLKTAGKVALAGGVIIVALQLIALVPHPRDWE